MRTIALILSRTMRSYKAATHSDLAALIEPIEKTYCYSKHVKFTSQSFQS
jgi:hypothetical protein